MHDDMSAKHCVVTGASSGIGKEISLGLAQRGASIIMICRDADRGRKAMEEIQRKTDSKSIDLFLADLSSQHQIRRVAAALKLKYEQLHVLVNNAGVVMDKRVLTEDGIEMTFAVNYLAYFMLTNLLINLLKAGAPSRIVNVSSMAYRSARLEFDNLQGEKGYKRDTAYALSKLADILFTYELGRRLEGTGVTVNSVCPGGVSSRLWENSNPLINYFFKTFMKGPEEGARLPVYLASSPEVEGLSGRYFQTREHLQFQHVKTRGAMCKTSPATYDAEAARQLWEVSEKLTGVSFPVK
ncbi:MAG: SDR family oxidoreductase [Dehalococcoidia bacterium]|jgi:NAD(P)-dependent dehydrogenase (short-subunit alcohol dehydrogenase family)